MAWHAFLTEVEDPAEQEARVVGRIYQRLADSRLMLVAIEATAHGQHPRILRYPGPERPKSTPPSGREARSSGSQLVF